MQPKNKFKTIIFIGIFLLGIILIVGILGALGVFHSNPFGNSTRIDNFSTYFKKVPTEKKDAVFAALYGTIGDNLDKSAIIPTSGAMIREGSVKTEYVEASLSNFSTFIVDIESIQQSYDVQMSWSNNPNTTVAGYEILITCPTKAQLIYPDFDCRDFLSSDPLNKLYAQNPIVYILPIVVSYYDQNHKLISYRINYNVIDDNTKIKLIITDYTGGNRERAIQTLKEKGIKDPEQYEIEYVDDSAPKFLTPPSDSND